MKPLAALSWLIAIVALGLLGFRFFKGVDSVIATTAPPQFYENLNKKQAGQSGSGPSSEASTTRPASPHVPPPQQATYNERPAQPTPNPAAAILAELEPIAADLRNTRFHWGMATQNGSLAQMRGSSSDADIAPPLTVKISPDIHREGERINASILCMNTSVSIAPQTDDPSYATSKFSFQGNYIAIAMIFTKSSAGWEFAGFESRQAWVFLDKQGGMIDFSGSPQTMGTLDWKPNPDARGPIQDQ